MAVVVREYPTQRRTGIWFNSVFGTDNHLPHTLEQSGKTNLMFTHPRLLYENDCIVRIWWHVDHERSHCWPKKWGNSFYTRQKLTKDVLSINGNQLCFRTSPNSICMGPTDSTQLDFAKERNINSTALNIQSWIPYPRWFGDVFLIKESVGFTLSKEQ